MRALHVQKVKGLGGSERFLLDLLPRLARSGVDVRMLVLIAGRAGRFVGPLRDLGVPVAVLAADGDLMPALPLRILRIIATWRPDVVHSHLVHANLYAGLAARSLGIPAIASQHDALPLLTRARYRPAVAATRRVSARTIAVSEHVRTCVIERGLARPSSIRLIPYGIEVGRWSVDAAMRQEARRHLRIGGDDVVLSSASALIPGKGHASLLRVLPELLARDPRVRVLIAGDGPERRTLELAARRFAPGTVRFLGWVEEIRDMLAATDVLVVPTQPSIGEGFGMIALESMAAGVPVVATAVGALPEIVKDGVAGLVVPPSDDGLREGLTDLLLDGARRRRLGEGARRVAARFSAEATAAATIDVYRELV